MWSFLNKRTHRGLRTWVLFILRDGPKNGAEVMNAMEEMSRGWWRPSPGSVYPLLESMAADGVVRKSQSDGKYTITEEGKEEVEWPRQFRGGEPHSFDDVVAQISSYVSYLEDLAKADGAKSEANSKKLRVLADRLSKLGVAS